MSALSLVLYAPSILSKLHAENHLIHIGGTIGRDFNIQQSGSGTGSILWPAAELMSEYIASPLSPAEIAVHVSGDPHYLWSWNDKFVLELGSGLGLVTATLLSAGARVIATDGEANVIDQLDMNIAANFNAEGDSYRRAVYKSMVYRWGDDVTSLIEGMQGILGQRQSSFDVILASDIIYGEDVSVWEQLMNTLHMLTDDLQNKSSFILMIAQSERYKEKEDMFYSMLSEHFELKDTKYLSAHTTCSLIPDVESKTKLLTYKLRI